MNEPVTVDDRTFEEVVLQSQAPVLVDFWAAWCGPCRAIAPILDQIAGEQAGKLVIAKLDVEENPELASRYGVTSLPALKIFKDGVVVHEIFGAMPKPQIERHLADFI